MRVLIFGAEGILGRALMREIPDARGTTRTGRPLSPDRQIYGNIDIAERGDLEAVFDRAMPDVVINCAGIVKSEIDKHDPRRVTAVNAVAPHEIAKIAAEARCRVIHVSTDCVYDGSRGGRRETDATDATDLYGVSKAAGELVDYDHCVTIRTSFIGPDARYHRGLLEWLRGQPSGGEISGYTHMLWSGLSAPELARVIHRYVVKKDGSQPLLAPGLWHVSGPVINKADLLETLIEAHGLSVRVNRIDEPRIDRTLDGSKFHAATGYVAPTWMQMAWDIGGDGEGFAAG